MLKQSRWGLLTSAFILLTLRWRCLRGFAFVSKVRTDPFLLFGAVSLCPTKTPPCSHGAVPRRSEATTARQSLYPTGRTALITPVHVRTRRSFLSLAGKSLGLAALSSATVASLLKTVEAATKTVAHLTPEEAAMDEDYWAIIQNSFTVTRGIINLNNGGVSPSPRIVTEALVRYTWQQEDATAYTMWQILEPQSETIRTGLAELFGCDREEIAITRNASESLEVLLMGMDF